MKQTIWISVTSIIVALIVFFGALHIAQTYSNAKQADFIATQVAQKTVWMQNINTTGDGIRMVNLHIRQQCLNGKAPSMAQQNFLRMQARQKFLAASSGSAVIFDSNTLNDIKTFFQFDRSIADVCSQSAPDDSKWLQLQTKISDDFKTSIDADKAEIAQLHGVKAS